jgi:hypothetical protein
MASSVKAKSSGGYEIGYRKPPARTRFKKGQSGNPNGRPKGALNIASVLSRTLREQVVINENGHRRVVTKLEAAVKQLVNKAATGDLKAFQQLSGLVQAAEEKALEAAAPSTALAEIDQKVLQGILKRFESSSKKGGNYGEES